MLMRSGNSLSSNGEASMKESEMYLRAARLTDSGVCRCCCGAVGMCTDLSRTSPMDALSAMREVFNPDKTRGLYWFGEPIAENIQHRVMALLLMHELAKDVGR